PARAARARTTRARDRATRTAPPASGSRTPVRRRDGVSPALSPCFALPAGGLGRRRLRGGLGREGGRLRVEVERAARAAVAGLVLGRHLRLRERERRDLLALGDGAAEAHDRPGVLLDRVALRLRLVLPAVQVHRLVRERRDRLARRACVPG